MKDFDKYIKDLESALRNFYYSSTETNKTSRLRLTEDFMDEFCTSYFDGVVFNKIEHTEFVEINKSVYEDFILQVEPNLEK